MATPIYLTGFEHGVASSSGTGLFNAVNNAAGISFPTSGHRSGTRCMAITHSGTNTNANISTGISGGTRLVGSFAFKINAYPASNAAYIATIATAAGGNLRFYVEESEHVIYCGFNDPTQTAPGAGHIAGPAISTDTWYVVDFDASVGGGTRTCDWRVDSVAQTQASLTVTGTTLTNFTFGNGNIAQTHVASYDDVLLSVTGADYPIGPVEVLALLPGSDGTHNTAGAVFINSDTATTPNFTNSTTTAYTFLDDALPWTTTRSTTDCISAETHVAGEYLEIKPATAASGKSNALGVRALLAYSSSATTANGGSATVARNSAGTEVEIFGNFTTGADYSETTNFFKGAIVTQPAGGWSKTEIEAIRWRIGRASNSSDVSPRPTWQALMLEIAYPPDPGGTPPDSDIPYIGGGWYGGDIYN